MNYGLCKEFPAMTPYDVEDKTFHSVISLYARVRRLQIREEKKQNTGKKKREEVIRRPAGDNWF